MNEQIKLLAEQADIVFGFDKNNDPEVICAVMDIEKFAELIVRECAKKIDEDVIVFTKNDTDTKKLCIEIIKEHFGVE